MTEANQQRPLVSVIIPCYNRENYISEAIDSVLRQTYPAIEIIVVDDGSTDNSIAVIKTYHDKVILIQQVNSGPSAARNTGIKQCRGDLLMFLDSDDYLSNEVIQDHVRAFERWPDAGVSSSDYAIVEDKIQSEVFPNDWPEPPDIPLEKLITEHLPFPACLMYKKQCIDSVDGFDESMRNMEDCDFLIRTVLSGAKMVKAKGEGYAIYRTTPNSITKTDGVIRFYQNRIRVIQKLLNMKHSSDPYFLSLVMQRLIKNRLIYWQNCLQWHFSLHPIEIAKFIYYLLRVSWIDPAYITFLINHKPWLLNDD